MSNGLSSWYDMLRSSPSTLLPITSEKVLRDVLRDYGGEEKSDDDNDDDVMGDGLETNESDDDGDEEVHGEENIIKYITSWIEKLTRSETLSELGDAEASPVNPGLAVRTDPYHGFSWDNRER